MDWKNIEGPMKILKNNLFILLSFQIFSACQTSRDFKIQSLPDEPNDLYVIQAKSSQIYQRCLFLNAEDESNWRHQHYIYILSDKKEIYEIMQPHHQDRETCYSQMKKIETILQTESQVKLCIRDKLEENLQDSKSLDVITQLDKVEVGGATYESQTLDSICNSKKCFSNNDLWVNTCPGFTKN